MAFMNNHRHDFISDPPHSDGVVICKDWNPQRYVKRYVEWETVLVHYAPFCHLKTRYLQEKVICCHVQSMYLRLLVLVPQ